MTADSTLDAIDRCILAELQANGRLPNSELASRVGLSESPCLRRVRRLEQDGFITGYHAHLEPRLVGHGLTIYVGVKVRRHASEETLPFEDWTRDRPEIAACFLISGEFDYLLHVAVADLGEYEAFLTGHLLRNPAIADIRSMVAVRNVKAPFGIEAALLPVRPASSR